MTTVHDVIDEHGNTEIIEPVIKATMVYDAFDSSNRTTVEIPWGKGKTALEYIGELPNDVEYGYATDKKGVISAEDIGTTILNPDEHLIVSVVPQGGKIAMIVGMVMAVVVASVFTMGAAGIGFAAGMASMGSMAWVAAGIAWVGAVSTITQGVMSMTRKQSKTDSSASYGIDGPKATNDENTPVPSVYGTMRVAGNKVNIFTENITSKRQKIYVQFVVSEGPVKSISAIELNGQSVDEYNNKTSTSGDNSDTEDDGDVVVTDVRLGEATQDVMPWFASSLSQYNINAKLTPDFATYTTQEEVNRIRLDLALPNGLYHVTSKKGKYVNWSVGVNADYALEGTEDWQSFAHDYEWAPIDYENGFTDLNVKGLRITVMVNGNDGEQTTPYSISTQYRNATAADDNDNSASWVNIGSESGSVSNKVVYQDGNAVFVAGSYLKTFEVSGLKEHTYSFKANGCTIVSVEAFYKQELSWTLNTTSEYRMSIMTPPLPLGTYKVRINRTGTESNNTSTVNSIYLVDITQYEDNPVAYNNTAYYGAQVKLGTEINGEPAFTALVEGKLVNIYDREGNITAFQWSDNPADITLDILLNTSNNYAISPTRIDFAAFDDWRQFCSTNNLQFNGIFDTISNVWDAAAVVTRVGRAGIVLEGLTWTVIIEAAKDPTMMFSQANIVKDTLSLQWTGRKDRANLYEVQYADKADDYKQHSAFAMDDSFIKNGDALIQQTVTLTGVTDATQAANEAYLLLNIARYVNQIISFDVPYQALGVSVGDVFLFQHDMVNWGFEGLITDVNDANFTIDTPLADTSGSWNVMVLQSLTNVATATITDVSGSDIVVTTFNAPSWTDADKTKPYYIDNTDQTHMYGNTDYRDVVIGAENQRIVINGVEFGVLDRTEVGSTEVHFTLDKEPGSVSGQNAQFFNLDLLCQAPISYVSNNDDGTQTWTAGAWENDKTPSLVKNMRVLLGTSSVKAKPFRVTKITYKDDHTRTVSGVEYNESIYGANPQPVPNYSGLTVLPTQCSNLSYTVGSDVGQNGSMTYYGDVSFSRPLGDQRIYSGARVYVNRNAGGFVLEQTPENPIEKVRILGNLGDIIQVRIVAQYQNGSQADYSAAPTVTFEIVSETMVPDNIDNTTLKAVGGIRLIALSWQIVDEPYIASYEIYEASTDDVTKGYRVFIGNANSFNRTGLGPNETAYYWIRTVSSAGTTSEWSTSVSATTSYVLTSDLEQDIANTAKVAQALLNSIGTPLSIEGTTLPDVNNYQDGQYINFEGKLLQKKDNAWVGVTGAITVNSDGTITQDKIPTITTEKVEETLSQQQVELLTKASQDSSLTTDQQNQLKQAASAGSATQSLINLAQQTVAASYNSDTDDKIKNLSFSDINGQITSDQVQNLDASKVSGQLTSDQIAALSAVKITGQLNSTQISSIEASQISTQISSDQISSLQATKVAGQISSDQIASLASNKINGQITSDQIQSVTASQISTQIVSDQIASVLTSKLSGLVSTQQIASSAITTDKISASAVVATSIAAGAVTIEKLSVVSTSNLIWNSCGTINTSGWTSFAGSQFKSVTDSSDSLFESRNGCIAVFIPANSAWNNDWRGLSWNGSKEGIPVTPGEYISFQCKVLAFANNGVVAVYVDFFDDAGNNVGGIQGNQIANLPASSTGDLANYTLVGTPSVKVVSGATQARLNIFFSTNSNDTWFCVTQAGIGPSSANATELPAWEPGGTTSIEGSQIVTESIDASKIMANVITADKLNVSSVSAAILVSGSVVSDTIAANAITTDKISAGAVVAASIAAGAVTAEKLSVGSPANVIWNSCGTLTADGWINAVANAKFTCLTDTKSARYVQGVGSITCSSPSDNSQPYSTSDGTVSYSFWGTPLPVSQSMGYVYAAARILPEWGTIACVGVDFVDASGNRVSDGVSGNTVTQNGSDAGYASYLPSWVCAEIPANAVYAKFWIMSHDTGSNGMFSFTQAMFGVSTVNTTVELPWVPGGVTQISGGAIIANTITATQIDASSVRASILTAGSVTADTIASNAVTTEKISAGAITSTQIAAQTIVGNNIAANTVTAANLVVSSVSAAILTANSISTNMLQAGAITADKIDANGVRAAVLTAGSVGATQIAAGSIDASKINVSSLQAAIITSGSITGDKIAGNTITGSNVAANTITGNNIAAQAITADKLSVSSFANILPNPCGDFEGMGYSGWSTGYSTMNSANPALRNVNSPNAGADGNVWVNWYCNGYGSFALYFQGTLKSDESVGVSSAGVACQEGQLVGGSIRLFDVTHSCSASVTLRFYDSSGNIIWSGEVNGAASRISNQYDARNINNYSKHTAIGKVPPGAASMAVLVWITNTSGSDYQNGDSSYVILTQGQLALLTKTDSDVPPWTPTGGTTVDGGLIKTGTISADKIVANSITSAQIQSGAIGTDQLAAHSIKADNLAVEELIVSSAQIGNLVVGTDHMQDNSITVYGTAYGGSSSVSANIYCARATVGFMSVRSTITCRDDGRSMNTMTTTMNPGTGIMSQTKVVNGPEGADSFTCPVSLPAGTTTIYFGVTGAGGNANGFAQSLYGVFFGRLK